MAYVNGQNASSESVWFLDSGCSNHMCGKKKEEIFSDLDTNFRKFVKLGNNSSMIVMGKGNIRQHKWDCSNNHWGILCT